MKKVQQKNWNAKKNKDVTVDDVEDASTQFQPPPASEKKPKRKCREGEKPRKSKNTEEDKVRTEEPKPRTGKCKEAEKSKNTEEDKVKTEEPKPKTGKCKETEKTNNPEKEEKEPKPMAGKCNCKDVSGEPQPKTAKCKEAEDSKSKTKAPADENGEEKSASDDKPCEEWSK